MNRKDILIAILIVVGVLAFSSGFIYLKNKSVPPAESPATVTDKTDKTGGELERQETPDFTNPTPFLLLAPEDCQDLSVSDEYVCIVEYASTTFNAVDALEIKLIAGASERLKAVLLKPKEYPMSWEYGGPDFLQDLPIGINMTQKNRDVYFDGICGLDAMVIYGGTGMDLEFEACRYYYAKQYLNVLQRLEDGVFKK